jgi:hypothetical protein
MNIAPFLYRSNNNAHPNITQGQFRPKLIGGIAYRATVDTSVYACLETPMIFAAGGYIALSNLVHNMMSKAINMVRG